MIDPRAVRRDILNMCYRSGMGHLGCSLSVVEILAAVYGSVDVQKIKEGAQDRDRVYLSKGHCAPAVYATLAGCGLLPRELLAGYAGDGSVLAGLVSHAAPGVELSTGALGHGINVAVGCALGLKRRGSPAKVYCVMGDGEAQEGAVWEALMFASHHSLSGLTIIIDDNAIGSVTQTKRVMRLPLWDMLGGFGVHVSEITDGHNVRAIKHVMGSYFDGDAPHVIIAHTIKGRGVSFMENEAIWHYRTLNADTYAQAMAEQHEAVPA